MVTRSPYHMCASSCAITSAARLCSLSDTVAGSSSRSVSRKKTAPAGRVLLALDRTVGHGLEPPRHGGRQPEARLEGRLVEAGKDAARVGRLALAEGVAVAVRAGRVEPAEVLVEASGEAEDEPRL